MIEHQCPFCGSSDIESTENLDIIFCSGYEDGGYITRSACEVYAEDQEGHCKYCFWDEHMLPPEELPENPWRTFGEIVREDLVFLCNDCGLGVNFGKREVIGDFFKKPEKCPKCNDGFLVLVSKHGRSVWRCSKFGLGRGKRCNYERPF